MNSDAVRMGLLYPGGGAEQDYYLFAEAMGDAVKFFLIGTRIGGSAEDDHGVAALLRTAEVDNLVEGARRLVPLRPDVVLWACTSGSFSSRIETFASSFRGRSGSRISSGAARR